MNDDYLVTLCSCKVLYDANYLQDVLEAHGVKAYICDELTEREDAVYSNVAEIRLQVYSRDLVAARDTVNSFDKSIYKDEVQLHLVNGEREVISIDDDGDWGRCPSCSSVNVVFSRESPLGWWWSLLFLGVAWIFVPMRNVLICSDCEWKWAYDEKDENIFGLRLCILAIVLIAILVFFGINARY